MAGETKFVFAKPRLRAHVKSRNGCEQCKRRKIKCQENEPICVNCMRRTLLCSYSNLDTTSATLPLCQPLDDVTWNLPEKELFHHFILHAHPQSRSMEDRTWLFDLPASALQYESVKLALLGAAASHLAQLASGNRRYRETGLAYRQVALSHMATPPASDAIDALYAARFSTYVLMFQSCCLEDGFTDMLVLSRGSDILHQRAFPNASGRRIFPWTNEGELLGWEQSVNESATGGVSCAQAALKSLAMLRGLRMKPIQEQIYTLLTRAALALLNSAWDGYMGLSAVHRYLACCGQSQLSELTSAEDQCASVLRAHFLAMHTIQATTPQKRRADFASRIPLIMMMRWVEDIYQELDLQWKHLVDWPLAIALCYNSEE